MSSIISSVETYVDLLICTLKLRIMMAIEGTYYFIFCCFITIQRKLWMTRILEEYISTTVLFLQLLLNFLAAAILSKVARMVHSRELERWQCMFAPISWSVRKLLGPNDLTGCCGIWEWMVSLHFRELSWPSDFSATMWIIVISNFPYFFYEIF